MTPADRIRNHSWQGPTMLSLQSSRLLRGARLIVAGLALALCMGVAGTQTASAQDIQITGPLAGQPAVRHMRQFRAERFRVTPAIGYTLQDEYARALFFGGEISYSFLEWLGVGVWGGGAPVAIDTDLTSQIGTAGQVTDRNRLSLPTSSGFSSQVGRIQWGISAHILFIPLRGKLSLFQAAFVDTDLYILAGVGIFGVEERSAVLRQGVTGVCEGATGRTPTGTTAPGCLSTQTGRTARIVPAPMVGLGLSLYFTTWIGLTIEWRAFPFAWNPSGTDESGLNADGSSGGGGFPDGELDGTDSRTTFNQMLNIGLTFILPPDAPITE